MTDKPNFIFILLDDMGWADLACQGSDFYETPNIDRLASEGMRFTDAYASCPVCSPTRASWMTGRYPARLGLTNYIAGHERGKVISAPFVHYLPGEEKTVADSLREGGYQTWHVGKWHLGERDYWPDRHGFDVNVGGCHWGAPKQGYFAPWGNPALDEGADGEYLTDRLTDEAIRLIENSDGRPFLLNMCYYSVHVPIQAKEAYVERYRAKAAEMGLDEVQVFAEDGPFPCEHKKDKRIIRRLVQSDPTYAAMIHSVDENVGRLLGALQAAGQADNTVVIFTSDNGGLATAEGSPTCNAPLSEGKGWMYEGGTREPLLIRAPGLVAPGTTCDVPVTTTDFYPTLLELAGLPAEPDRHCDGVSIAPLLRADGRPQGRREGRLDREAIYWHYPHYGNQGGTPGCSVRADDWKLIELFEDGRLELYNLRDDVGEDNDLADEEPDRRDRLHKMLVAWRDSVAAELPRPNPDFQPWY
ncbi:MAG: sulfatase [Planctomycetota bacterium]